MYGDDIQTNVVLTADNSQYDQSMSASAQQTDRVGMSIDSLGQKMNNLSKSAGRKLIGFAAADVATITGATVAWAAYEKQMSRLQAQAAVTTRSREAEIRTMNTYADTVRNLRREFGTTTADAAALTQTISKMSDGTASLKSLTTTFTEMSNATGESSQGLAASLLNLQKIMGTPQRQTSGYADQLTTLAASANTSATALADFTSQIAPVGRTLGISQTALTGMSKAFIQAGQDGYGAATAFSKIVSNISYAAQTGSPDLAKYANLVGVTVNQFKQMEGADKIIAVFDSLSSMGPRAVTELNRMGLDGVRTLRSITALTQQSGGLGAAVAQAQDAYGNGATAKGSEAAMKGMTDELARLRQELQMTGEEFAKIAGPMVTAFLAGLTKVAGVINNLMAGPFGTFLATMSAIAAPILSAGGALLIMAGAIFKVATAFTAFRSSAAYGLREGLGGAGRITAERDAAGAFTGNFAAPPGGYLGRRGQEIAEGRSWFRRYQYNLGQGIGYGINTVRDYTGMGTGERSLMSRAAGGGAYFMRNFISPSLDQARYANPDMRSTWVGRYFPGISPQPVSAAMDKVTEAEHRAQQAEAVHSSVMGAQGTTPADKKASADRVAAAKAEVSAAKAAEAATIARATADSKAAQVATASAGATKTGFAALTAETANLTRGMASTALATAKLGVSAVGTGLGKLGGGLMGALGGPWGLALTGAMFLPMIMDMFKGKGDQTNYGTPTVSSSASPYFQAGGIRDTAAVAAINSTTGLPSQGVTRTQARRISGPDISAAQVKDYQLTNPALAGMSKEQAAAFLSTRYTEFARNPQALQAMKLDLISQFGPTGAMDVMNSLATGTAGGLTTFTGAALGASSRASATSNMGRAFSFLNDQALAGWKMGDTKGYAQARVGGLSQLMTAFNAGPPIDKAHPDAQMERTAALADMISKQYGIDTFSLFAAMTNPTAASMKYSSRAQSRGVAGSQAQLIGGALTAGDSGTLKSILNMAGVQNTSLTGQAAFNALVEALAGTGTPGQDRNSYQYRIRQLGQAGRMFERSGAVQSAILNPEDQNKQYRAVNEMLREFEDLGMTAPQITKAMGDIKATVGDPTSAEYILANAVIGKSQQELGYQMPFMTRTQQFGAQASLFQAQRATIMGNPGDPNRAANMEQATDTFMQAANAQGDYFKQLLYQQREFNVSMQRAQEDFAIQRDRMEQQYNLSRSRAQTDFNIQRSQQEHDYQLSRTRAEFDFNLARDRATEQYNRSLKRGYQDYTLSRRRQEQDYNHQVKMMAEQSARSMYDIYKRVQVQQTNSATWLLVNNRDQVRRMREQEADLNKLRRMGLSDNAIQQLDLTNPQNAQQLARFVSEVTADPKLIKQFNEQVRDRIKAASKLTKDESSQEWEEFQRQYEISRKRAAEDFKRSVARSHQDFKIQMSQMNDDFRRSMSRQAEDFSTAEQRQQESFSRSMSRAAQDYGISVNNMQADFTRAMNRAHADLTRSSTEITGDLETILEKATNKLSGHAGKQAGIVLTTLRGLDVNAQQEGIQIMEHFSKIFGFKYNPPKIQKPPQVSNQGGHEPTNLPYAAGGVFPGYTPGRDVHHYYGADGSKVSFSGGEGIMVPEWVRAMGGPAAIKQMNHDARYGGKMAFASGGVMNPDKRVYMDGEPVSAITKAQLLLAEKLFHVNLRTMQGSWQPWTPYSLGSHMGPGVVDEWPGSFVTQAQLRKVGFAAWARNIAGAASAGSGAHVHAVSRLDPGARGNSQLAQFAAGGDGLGGTDYGPNPPMLSGLMGMLAQFSGLALSGGSSGGPGGSRLRLKDILKDTYPALEHAARQVKLGGGFPDNFWSDKINAAARDKWQALVAKYGMPYTETHASTGPSGAPPAGPDHGSVRDLVHKAMLQAGFSEANWPALQQLVSHESSWNPVAQNPGSSAYGLFQFLKDTWATVGGHKTSDPWLQSVYGMKYIKSRYGNPINAWDFWQSHHWYGDGAVFDGPQTIGVGEKGPEAVIPLDDRGANFMATLMEKYTSGRTGRGIFTRGDTPVCVHNSNSYNIDKSTNFTGPITVAASNPQEFIAQLRQRQKVMALKNPAIGGVRL